jgi:curli biogenesis system outer membrane secretion channel CsgG
MLAERLRKTNEFSEISRSESDLAPDKKVLLVEGVITGYNRGCKFCEWFFFGINDKGKSSVSVRVKLVDATTGNVLTDADIQGRAKEPGYGSSRYDRIVDEIVDLIHNVNRGKS